MNRLVPAVLLVFAACAFDAQLPNVDSRESALVSFGSAVQSGTATSSATGTVTVTIPAIDPARSFLLFNARHSNADPGASMVRGRIASSTSLEFIRDTDQTNTVDIQWYVVEYASGIIVQRGEIDQTATPLDTAITPVASLSQAFVVYSKEANAADTVWSQDDPIVLELTATDNLQLRVDDPTPGHIISYQVIEFTDPAMITVQRALTSMVGGATSTSVTLPTAVDTTKSFVLVDFSTPGGGADVGARLLRAQLVDGTTVTVDRAIAGDTDDISEIGIQVVELNDGTRVQHASEAFAAGESQRVVSVAAVDNARATAFSGVQAASGQTMGSSPFAGNDIPGVATATMAIADTSLTLDRTDTSDAADIAWFAVEWGPECGNGVVEFDEDCDGGLCCDASCRFVTAGTECRGVAGLCDVAETCPGDAAACPADQFVTGGTECRGVAGLCDVAETCPGDAAACPADQFVATGTECRGAAGLCDVAETCPGDSAGCPSDVLVPEGLVCRIAAGTCDVQEECDGMNAACPTDQFEPLGTECNASTDSCDPAETCSGTEADCPSDVNNCSDTPDAGAPDAGPDETPDAAPGDGVDASGGAADDESVSVIGCACRADSGGRPPLSSMLLMVFAVLAIRRRRSVP